MATLVWIAFLLIALGILKFAPGLVRRLTLASLGEEGRAGIGRKVLDQQPDRITLSLRPAPPGAEAGTVVQALSKVGYQRAGSYSVAEMGGLPIHFLVKPSDSAVAAVYEHPKAGVWFDLFTRYQDGTSFTFNNARMGGKLEQRPGHPTVRVPGIDPATAHARFLRERTSAAMRSFQPAEVPQMFADAYAESIAWRKQHGISAAEVQKVGMEKFNR
jgi:hypothetical protein